MSEKKLSKKDLLKAFWRWTIFCELDFNYEGMQNLGYCYGALPIIKKTRKDPKEFKKAFKANLNFFNTNPILGYQLINGVHAALEESGADVETVESFKTALMGPMAGIGDSLIWGLYSAIVFGIGAGMAINGNPTGPIISMVLWAIPMLLLRYWSFFWAYKQGVNAISQIGKGIVEKVQDYASVLGCIVIGGFATSIMSRLHTPLQWSKEYELAGEIVTQVTSLQDTLDGVMPNILAVTFVGLTYWMFKKGLKNTTIFAILAVVGFVFGALGWLAR